MALGNIPPSPPSWRPIPGFPGYEASDDGRVRRTSTGRVLVARKVRAGHYRVKLTRGGKRADQYIQRLVCLAFNGEPPDPNLQACHHDGDPANNTPWNLYWGTPKQNAADRRRHGRDLIGPGSRNPRAKLDESAVRQIRARLESAEAPKEIADEYGVSAATIHRIQTRETWSHVL